MIQVVVISLLPFGNHTVHTTLHLASYGLLGMFAFANRRIAGVPVIALGGLSNFAAIAANGGVMPTRAGAAASVGHKAAADEFINSRVLEHPRLQFLGDVFATPAKWPLHNVFSIGDAILLLGVFILVHAACDSRLFPRNRSTRPERLMFREALAVPAARRFFMAHALSCLGTGLAYVALPLLAYDRFGTPWAVTAVLLPDLLPAIVLGPLLGALVDRIGWRTCAVVADVLRMIAFVVIMTASSLPIVIIGSLIAGVGTALFAPSALAGLPRLVDRGESRAAVMGLYGAIDDLGLTAGPALAAVALAVVSPLFLMAVNAVTFALSAVIITTVVTRGAVVVAGPATTLFADARAGLRELASRPEVRVLLASSSGVVFCLGVTNVGEVVLAREVLGVGGSGLAAMVAAGGLGTVLGSLCTRFTTAGDWMWRRAYTIGLFVLMTELVVCSIVGNIWVVIPMLALGGFGNGLALVHDRMLLSHATPESLHGRLFGLQKTCVSFAFALSFLASGALIATIGVQSAFLVSGLMLSFVTLFAVPRLRRAWPAPTPGAGRASLGAHGEIAQLVEHTTENRGVPGSSPGLAIDESGFAASLRRASAHRGRIAAHARRSSR